MKFRVSMKDPDCLYDAIQEAVTNDVKGVGLADPEEVEAIVETRSEKVKSLCVKKWFTYGEYLEVEIDTEAGTCVVIEQND